MERNKYIRFKIFKLGFIKGLGWSFGVTVGFVIISTIIVIAINFLGGLPLIGKWIADIFEETQIQLGKRSILSN